MTPQPAARGPAGERGPGRLGAHLLASPTSLVLTLIGAPHAKKKKRKRKKEKKRKTKGRAEQKERAARMRGPWRRRWDAPAASAGLAARAASAACSQRPREAGTAVASLPLGGGPHVPAAFRTVGSGGGCGPFADGGSQAGAGAQLCLKHPAHTEAGTEVELTGPLPNERTLRADHRRARKPRSSGTAGPVLSSAASVRSAGAAPRPRDPRRQCQALLGAAQGRLGRGGARLAASVLLGADARAQGVLSHTGSGCPPAGEWVGAGRG